MHRVQRCGLFLQLYSVICLYVGHNSEPCTKTDEPIEMLFGLWTRVGPRKEPRIYTDGGPDPQVGMGFFFWGGLFQLPPIEMD